MHKENQRIYKPFSEYVEGVWSYAGKVNQNSIHELLRELLRIYHSGNQLFVFGNGGSASTAEHFVTDIGVGSHIRGGGLRARCLSSEASTVTALSNDVGYHEVFRSSLELAASPGDLILCLSASGNSPNILKALEIAKIIGVKSCALVGFQGGKAVELADISIHVRTPVSEYGPVEDAHLMLCHYLTEVFREMVKGRVAL